MLGGVTANASNWPANAMSKAITSHDSPRYRWLANQLSEQIKQGGWPPGEAMPPERKIAAQYQVSRVTVRRALRHLGEAGLIEQRQGSGTYVSQRMRQPLSILTSFSEDVRARGSVPESEFLDRSIGAASPEEAIGLGLKPGARVSRITRLRHADGISLAVEIATIVEDALPDPEAVEQSLYETLAQRGLRPARAIQRLSAVGLEPRYADLLGVPAGTPGLYIVRVGYTADDTPIEYTRSYFRGDRWDFIAELA